MLGTLPGRAIVIGLAVTLTLSIAGRLLGGLPSFLEVVNTVAAIALALGCGYFVLRGLMFARRRLLWRVRRKLIISYIFIGVVPAILIVLFFLLGGLLLFYNFSAYLVRNEVRQLTERADRIASGAAAELERTGGGNAAAILERRQLAAAQETPGISLTIVRANRSCGQASGDRSTAARPAPGGGVSAGPWTHMTPPTEVPAWIGCGGFQGVITYSLDRPASARSKPAAPVIVTGEELTIENASTITHMLVRGVAFPESPAPPFAVVADIDVNREVADRVRRDTGVLMTSVAAQSTSVTPLEGTPRPEENARADGATLPFASIGFLESHDWRTGETGPLLVAVRFSISEIYDHLSPMPALVSSRNIVLVLLVIVGGLFLIIEIVALITGLALARSITGSVHELFAGTERVQQGDLTQQIAVRAPDQLGELAASFNSMTDSIKRLLIQEKVKERLEEELRIAHDIQMSLLPQGALSVPGLSITAICKPAREVGGDYYDFLRLDDGRLGVLIADVSGKGTSAALYMAELKGLILSLSRICRSPRELLIMANRLIAEHLDARSFITVTYAVVDLRAKTITYARAGHTPLMHLASVNGATRLHVLAPDGMVVGLKIDNGEMFERLLQEETIPLGQNDVYMLYTDGITEAMNNSDDCFGEGRLGALLEEHAHLPAEELRERVLREIAAFVGSAPQHDDMTLILLKVDNEAELGNRVVG